MSTRHTNDGRGIDRDHYEESPSTGWREATIICGGELPDDHAEDFL